MNMMRWSVTVVGCLAILAGLGYFKFTEISTGLAEAAAFPEQSETVEVAAVSATDYAPTLTVVGEVVAPRRLDLRNEIAGEITAVNFTSGAPVSQGQVLIQLDISVEEANLQAARARAELARLVFGRNRELLESGFSNTDQVDRARADLDVALAEIAVLERTIAKKTLRAPFAGRAGLHTFEVGQYLPSNTVITTLVGDTDFMWVDFQVPQFYRRLPAGAELGVTAIENDDARQVTATVIAENTVLNAQNRSRFYRASIPSNVVRYSANSMVNVAVPTGEVQRLLRVPPTAVLNDPLGQFVFVLREDESGGGLRARRQRVTVRAVTTDHALLERGTGLAEGDRIAAAGAFKLYEGILVIPGQRTPAGTDRAGEPPHGAPSGERF